MFRDDFVIGVVIELLPNVFNPQWRNATPNVTRK